MIGNAQHLRPRRHCHRLRLLFARGGLPNQPEPDPLRHLRQLPCAPSRSPCLNTLSVSIVSAIGATVAGHADRHRQAVLELARGAAGVELRRALPQYAAAHPDQLLVLCWSRACRRRGRPGASAGRFSEQPRAGAGGAGARSGVGDGSALCWRCGSMCRWLWRRLGRQRHETRSSDFPVLRIASGARLLGLPRPRVVVGWRAD